MAMNANTVKIIEFLKAHKSENLTAADVATALDLGVKSVNATFTFSIQNKDLGFRDAHKVEIDGAVKEVKFLKLNDAGLAFDPTAVVD